MKTIRHLAALAALSVLGRLRGRWQRRSRHLGAKRGAAGDGRGERLRTANAGAVHGTALGAAGSAPSFGSVVQSAGAVKTGISSTFDGNRLAVTVGRQGASDIVLDSANTIIDGGREQSLVGLPGRSSRSRVVFSYTDTSATLAEVAVDWANDDPADYLSGGYWLHVDGDVAAGIRDRYRCRRIPWTAPSCPCPTRQLCLCKGLRAIEARPPVCTPASMEPMERCPRAVWRSASSRPLPHSPRTLAPKPCPAASAARAESPSPVSTRISHGDRRYFRGCTRLPGQPRRGADRFGHGDIHIIECAVVELDRSHCAIEWGMGRPVLEHSRCRRRPAPGRRYVRRRSHHPRRKPWRIPRSLRCWQTVSCNQGAPPAGTGGAPNPREGGFS